MNGNGFRLAKLSLPGKLLVTLFLLIIGPGYLFGIANIFFKHQYADDRPGLTLDDLRATFHGMERTYKPEDKVTVNSEMLTQVRPDGEMRGFLEKGGDPAIRGLVAWLENGAKEEQFTKEGLAQAGDPSAQAILKTYCIECHHADGGDMEEVPYAETAESDPRVAMVLKVAKPEFSVEESGVRTKVYKPTGQARLLQITHVHILTLPVLTLIVGALFLMTDISSKWKLGIGPLPMLALLLDISGWWLARWFEPWIYMIAAAGGLFAAIYALQILSILGSMWIGRERD
jgi:hypothetical protein